MGYWHGYLSGVWCKWFAYGPADSTATPLSLASVKSRTVYFLGPAYPGCPAKTPLNVCMYVRMYVLHYAAQCKATYPVKDWIIPLRQSFTVGTPMLMATRKLSLIEDRVQNNRTLILTMTSSFNPLWATVVTHTRATDRGQRSVSSNDTMETDGQTDRRRSLRYLAC